MEKSIAIFAIINFTIMGLSHVVQHQAWREFFRLLHSKGRPGAFANGFLTLTCGSLIVAFHNVWSGPPVILTLIGWAYLIKSTVIFVNPAWGLRSMASVQDAPRKKFLVAGIVLLVVALMLTISIVAGYYPAEPVS